MNIRRAFVFFIEDRSWPPKALVGMLLHGIPAAIFGRFGFDGNGADRISTIDFSVLLWSGVPMLLALLATGGYQMRITRRAAERRDIPLPRWDYGGDLVIDGFRSFGVTVGWVAGICLVVVCPVVIVVVSVAVASDGNALGWSSLGGGGWLARPLLSALGNAAFGTILAAAIGRAAIERSIGAGLDIGEILRTVRGNFGALLAVSAIGAGFTLVTSLVGAFPPVAELATGDGWGWVPVTVASALASLYTGVATAHLYGQVSWLSNGDAPVDPQRTPSPGFRGSLA